MSLSALTAHLYLTTHATATRRKLDTAARVRVVRGGCAVKACHVVGGLPVPVLLSHLDRCRRETGHAL